MSVRIELQADCFAGVWAARNKDRLEPGDVEEGMTAANAIGDDTLQKESQGTVMPDKFTHGTSAQRMKWLRRGLETAIREMRHAQRGDLGAFVMPDPLRHPRLGRRRPRASSLAMSAHWTPEQVRGDSGLRLRLRLSRAA